MREWTLMFFFAGDNALAPVVVSLLKEVKDAGFQANTDVLVYFDTNGLGVPTRIYDVNSQRKRNQRSGKSKVGDANDSFVRTMAEDDIMREDTGIRITPGLAAIRQTLKKSDAINAEEALISFLKFCRQDHRAKHYMLFLVGHGMIVANDAFLPDDNPVSAITLKKLGTILHGFTRDIKSENGTKGAFELLTLHSCSLSAIEVAYQLKGTAKYMMASEGGSFLGSWPYRQLLKKVFNSLEQARKGSSGASSKRGKGQNKRSLDIKALVEKLYFHTLFNARDFLLAGFSHDLALCSLDPQKFDGVTESIRKLVAKLRKGLKASSSRDRPAVIERRKRIKELVVLAHLEAQSYFGESYTDLFDFCRCLGEKCNANDLQDLRDASFELMDKLNTIRSEKRSERFQALVIHSRTFGSQTQYSHGLSVFFPWSRPIENVTKLKGVGTRGSTRYEDEEKGILERYKEYTFTTALGANSWLSFLESYFDQTRRQSRLREDLASAVSGQSGFNPLSGGKPSPLLGKPSPLLGKPSPLLGKPSPLLGKPSPLLGKPSPLLSAGDDKPSPLVGTGCACPSIKNYPEEEVLQQVQPKKRKSVRNNRKRFKGN